jgi:type VI secretion system ImpC/EvpB family protein
MNVEPSLDADRPVTLQGAEAAPAPSADSDRSTAQHDPLSWADLSAVGVRHVDSAEAARLDAFLRASSPAAALRWWLGQRTDWDPQQVLSRLNRDIAAIDTLINQQLNAILHHPVFQKLEASWRGIRYLAERADEEGERNVTIRILNASWSELERDFERALEFDQSQLFQKIYEEEYGMSGGVPYGVLLADYEIRPRVTSGYPHDDMATLRALAGVAAAAFCPVLISVHPAMFGLDDFAGLEHYLDHAKTLQQLDYLQWNNLRKSEDARFVGLVLPRVLMRLPYKDDGTRFDRFCFREDVTGPDHRKYLWGSAVYAMGGVLIRAFAQSGWLADIRGVRQDVDGGGLVKGLPVHSFGTDQRGIAAKTSTDLAVTDALERELSDLGFTCLCDCQGTGLSAFYSLPSIQQPQQFSRPDATANAKLSAMLSYTLCVSRFAHYLKIIGRNKVGTLSEPEELQNFLKDWVAGYVHPDSEAAPETKARYPLREAGVEVIRLDDKPGTYQCIMRLAPHYELEQLSASIRLSTELAPPRLT